MAQASSCGLDRLMAHRSRCGVPFDWRDSAQSGSSDAAAQFRLAPSPAAVEAQAASAGNEKAEGAAETIKDAEAALERTAGLAAPAGGAP
jgi:hypothetical protein